MQSLACGVGKALAKTIPLFVVSEKDCHHNFILLN